MSHEIEVSSWEEFEGKVRQIRSDNQDSSSALQFRGQADYRWNLETTLERRSYRSYSFADFYRIVYGIHPEVESFTSANWMIPNFSDTLAWCKDYAVFSIPSPDGVTIPAYDFIAHLRHNGFPSPLLDWTYSPYVAAYFAFAQAKAPHVAIYIFCEKPQNMKTFASNQPQIIPLSKFVKTHVRHFRQQSTYTMCGMFDFHEKIWKFFPHHSVFGLKNNDQAFPQVNQDLLWKIKVPTTERPKVLKVLDDYNLNEYSLFGSEESLMQTLAIREIDLK